MALTITINEVCERLVIGLHSKIKTTAGRGVCRLNRVSLAPSPCQLLPSRCGQVTPQAWFSAVHAQLACADVHRYTQVVPSADPPEPIDAFIDEYRARALWFLRDDYYPQDEAELLRVLDHVEQHGDLTAFRRVAAIRQWLSQHSNATSAV